jgi:hypothetical protein
MSDLETAVVFMNLLSGGIGFVLMQTRYRGFTIVERLSLALLIAALVLSASMHILDGRSGACITEAVVSAGIFFRMLTAAAWRFTQCGKCTVTIL